MRLCLDNTTSHINVKLARTGRVGWLFNATQTAMSLVSLAMPLAMPLMMLWVILLVGSNAHAQNVDAVRVPNVALRAIESDDNLTLTAFELARDGGVYFEVLSSVPVRLLNWDVKQVYWMSLDSSSCRLISNLQRSPLGAWQASSAVSQCTKFTATTD